MAGALKQRILSFDWLKGLAVLFMIQCHSLMFLLDPSLKTTTWYRTLLKIDGLVAPSFIFSAGFSLALTQVRTAQSGGLRQGQALKTVRRLLEVLAAATFINWCWFPVYHEPRWFLRLDILHCIGISLLTALPLLIALASRPVILRWMALLLSLGIWTATRWAKDVTGWPSLFLNQSSGALFPLLPWSAYVFLGASAGAVAGQGNSRTVVYWLSGLGILGFIGWQLFELDHPQRVFWVMSILLLLMLFESRATAALTWRPLKWIEHLGSNSLSAYCWHELVLFYGPWWIFALALLIARRLPPKLIWALSPLAAYAAWRSIGLVRGFSMSDYFRDKATAATYLVLLVILLGVTFALTKVTDAVYRKMQNG